MSKQMATVLFATLGLFTNIPSLVAQTIASKVGGICFRVDDDQPISNWVAFAKVFDKYRYHFTFALNLGIVDQVDEYFQMIRNLQASGHEFADHTPDHTTLSFSVRDTTPYTGLKGVDHTAPNRIFLQYQDVDTSTAYYGDGLVDIHNGFAFSRTPGAFKNFVLQGVGLIGIYIPATGKLYGVGNVYASDPNDIDTLQLRSIWGESIDIPDTTGVYCHIVGQYDVHMSDDAVGLFVQRTLQLCSAHEIQRPYAWIQPGGRFPVLNRMDVKKMIGDPYGYTAAESLPYSALKCYDEYDPDQDKRFGVDWGDFYDDMFDLRTNKSIIADKVAKHYFLVGHSHFSSLLGGWSGYLSRVDSLLAWCQANSNRIQVVTYSEMAHLLYDVPQNPYVNIIPPLNVDLDGNGVPDGYSVGSAASLDTMDGVPSDGGYSFRTASLGTICSITALGGLEKGENDFSIWTKGSPGDSISVTFSMSGHPAQVYKLPAETSNWTNYSLRQSLSENSSLVIPTDVSTVDIAVRCTSLQSGVVKISGMSLRKKLDVPLRIVSSPDTTVVVGNDFVNNVEVASIYPADVISYHLATSPSWIQISTGGAIQGTAPLATGVFPITIVASDQHGNSDSLAFDLHVVEAHHGGIQIVSTPDTVVAPNATYYYSVYATDMNPEDSLKYSILAGPRWLTMSAEGILSGMAPKVDSGNTLIKILVQDEHADADTQSYSLSVHSLLVDDFNYDDSPLNHGWYASLGSGDVSVSFDSTIHAHTMNLSTSGDLDFGVDKYGRWLANTLTASVKSTSEFMFKVWLVDSNGVSLYIKYYSDDGLPEVNPDNTISVHLGSKYQSGNWQSLARDVNKDLESVQWGATVRRILGLSVRGSVQLGDLELGKELNATDTGADLSKAISFDLRQNYPNPFNPTTRISYRIARPSHVTIRIYNVLGQVVRTLLRDNATDKGEYVSVWRGDNDSGNMVSSGVYFCQLVAAPIDGSPKYSQVKKMMLIR